MCRACVEHTSYSNIVHDHMLHTLGERRAASVHSPARTAYGIVGGLHVARPAGSSRGVHDPAAMVEDVCDLGHRGFG